MFCNNSCNNNNSVTLASLVDSSTVATSGCYTGFIPVSVNYNVVPGGFFSGNNCSNTNNLSSANPFSALDNTTQVYNRSSSCCRCCRCCCRRCCCR